MYLGLGERLEKWTFLSAIPLALGWFLYYRFVGSIPMAPELFPLPFPYAISRAFDVAIALPWSAVMLIMSGDQELLRNSAIDHPSGMNRDRIDKVERSVAIGMTVGAHSGTMIAALHLWGQQSIILPASLAIIGLAIVLMTTVSVRWGLLFGPHLARSFTLCCSLIVALTCGIVNGLIAATVLYAVCWSVQQIHFWGVMGWIELTGTDIFRSITPDIRKRVDRE